MMPGTNRDRIAVQAHCLRREMAADYPATLGRLQNLGISRIELCSFPGCAGNPWGDFGSLASWRPEDIRRELDAADFDCLAVHVSAAELEQEALETTLRWVQSVGSRRIVLAALPVRTESDPDRWREGFEQLNHIGERLRRAGFEFAYHTQNGVWSSPHGDLIADAMFRVLDPSVCLIELDASGALVFDVDWMKAVRENPGRFFAMHLRDGIRPQTEVAWLPAVPLGVGDTDWISAFEAAAAATIDEYVLEMEVGPETDAFEAIAMSLEFLRSLDT